MATIKAIPQNGGRISYKPLFTWRAALDTFRISPTSGEVQLAMIPDFEKVSSYHLQFAAIESTTNLESTCFLNIDVEDVNDNSPIFRLDHYDGRVAENSPVGTEILQIKAVDRDTGPGGQVRGER